MDNFLFLMKPKEKNASESLENLLYIEEPPLLKEKEEIKDDKTERGVVIIDLFGDEDD